MSEIVQRQMQDPKENYCAMTVGVLLLWKIRNRRDIDTFPVNFFFEILGTPTDIKKRTRLDIKGKNRGKFFNV